MVYVNNYQCCGNLAREPELYHYETGDCVRFVVALNKPRREKAIYIECVAWNEVAHRIVDWCHKGTEIFLSGEIETNTYQDRRGSHHKAFTLKVEKFSISRQPASSPEGAVLKSPRPPL